MAIVKMKRLRVITLAEQRDELLSRLLHVGCVEVTEPKAMSDPEWTALLNRDTGAQGAGQGPGERYHLRNVRSEQVCAGEIRLVHGSDGYFGAGLFRQRPEGQGPSGGADGE